MQPLPVLAEDADQLLVGDADDGLRRGEGVEHVLADGALAHGGDEVLGDLEVDVGFEQGAAHLAHRVIDVLLGQAALAAEAGEGFIEPVGERFEHVGLSGSLAMAWSHHKPAFHSCPARAVRSALVFLERETSRVGHTCEHS